MTGRDSGSVSTLSTENENKKGKSHNSPIGFRNSYGCFYTANGQLRVRYILHNKLCVHLNAPDDDNYRYVFIFQINLQPYRADKRRVKINWNNGNQFFLSVCTQFPGLGGRKQVRLYTPRACTVVSNRSASKSQVFYECSNWCQCTDPNKLIQTVLIFKAEIWILQKSRFQLISDRYSSVSE